MNNVTYAVIELARTAGSFMATLVDQDSISSFADPDAMKLIIEGLTKFILASNFLSLSSDKEFAQRNGAGSRSCQEDFFPYNFHEAHPPQCIR